MKLVCSLLIQFSFLGHTFTVVSSVHLCCNLNEHSWFLVVFLNWGNLTHVLLNSCFCDAVPDRWRHLSFCDGKLETGKAEPKKENGAALLSKVNI